MGSAQDSIYWLPLFSTPTGFVYTNLPPATTVGHRAETWNVDKWLAEVTVRVLAADEECCVRLEDPGTGELYAECPVPTDRPLVTVVEPVIDSSRYFVLRVADRASGRHAFLGLGFGTRGEASDFNAALYEHAAYVRRKRRAEEMRREWQAAGEAAATDGSSDGGAPALAPPVDSALHASLSPGQPLKIALPPPGGDGSWRSGFISSRLADQTAQWPGGDGQGPGSGATGQAGLPLLMPPPGTRGPPRPSPQAGLPQRVAEPASSEWGDFVS